MMIPISFVEGAHAAGLCVIPPAQDGTKRPAPPGDDTRWKHYQTKRPSLALLQRWYDPRNGLTGIGVLTGKISGNLEVMDFDTLAGWHAYQEMAEHCGVKPLLDRIWAGYGEESPRGTHLLYRAPIIASNTKLARDASGKAFIETRGEGGYVIIAPSNGAVHPSGGQYRPVSGSLATIASISEIERNDLWELAKSMDLCVRRPDAGDANPILSSSNPANRPGEDFNRRATWSEVLEPHGWIRVLTRGEVTYWRRPGKHAGISATTGFQGTDYLYVFSTSTPLDSERAYTKFGVYALLDHGGDFRAATRILARSGYGDSKTAPEFREGMQPRKPSPSPFSVVVGEQPRKSIPPLIPLADYIALPKARPYLIKGVLPARGLAQLFGDANVGKSFVAIDIGCHIALGIPWRGIRTHKTGVVYIAAEGLAGLQARFAAWCQQMGEVPDRFWIREYPVGLTSAESVSALVEMMDQLSTPVGLIILDTFAGNFGSGSENDAEDMALALSGMRMLGHERTVLNIHHTGHADKTRGRGHSSLFAAIDVELLIARQGDEGVLILSHTKARDFDRMAQLAFRIERVNLPWTDDDGEPIDSAMVVPADAEPPAPVPLSLSRKQEQALTLLKQLYAVQTANLGGTGTPRVRLKDWYEAMDFEPDKGHRTRLRGALEAKKMVYLDNGFVYVS